jgi:hypothetical protein
VGTDNIYFTLFERDFFLAMPLPIQNPPMPFYTNLHKMSFEEAALLPFNDDRQPSLLSIRQEMGLIRGVEVSLGDRELREDALEHHKLTQTKFLRGIVKSKDCMKPRFVYSLSFPNRMKPNEIDGAVAPTA